MGMGKGGKAGEGGGLVADFLLWNFLPGITATGFTTFTTFFFRQLAGECVKK
ncbi:MAG TPA: hypothetical protein PLP67_08390 [Methylotenera sp.]|nr:hypothetical protein [Methylotenera sp.]HPM49878.1 hypothetical protein [Methylotenera sp.]